MIVNFKVGFSSHPITSNSEVQIEIFASCQYPSFSKRTGETIKIAAAKLPKFPAGKAFKDAVNKQD